MIQFQSFKWFESKPIEKCVILFEIQYFDFDQNHRHCYTFIEFVFCHKNFDWKHTNKFAISFGQFYRAWHFTNNAKLMDDNDLCSKLWNILLNRSTHIRNFIKNGTEKHCHWWLHLYYIKLIIYFIHLSVVNRLLSISYRAKSLFNQ